MPMPDGRGAIDLMLDVPDDASGTPSADPVTRALRALDAAGIERALIDVDFDRHAALRALKDHPDRFIGSAALDPNRGMDEVRKLVTLREAFGVVAASVHPAACVPQVPIDDKKLYPLYARCVELDLPICLHAGVPAERVPMQCQQVARIDEVCWFFPELRFVMRGGGEPWTELAVKLMLKWPNLFYSTGGLAPRDYPPAIVAYANTRGADKILYAGGAPDLSPAQAMRELRDVPFRAAVWPRFLRENAVRVFRL
jgi:predicted TIM-barrel fold metal-dependent hydrolase